MAFTEAQVKILEAKLDSKHVRTRRVHDTTLAYVEGPRHHLGEARKRNHPIQQLIVRMGRASKWTRAFLPYPRPNGVAQRSTYALWDAYHSKSATSSPYPYARSTIMKITPWVMSAAGGSLLFSLRLRRTDGPAASVRKPSAQTQKRIAQQYGAADQHSIDREGDAGLCAHLI